MVLFILVRYTLTHLLIDSLTHSLDFFPYSLILVGEVVDFKTETIEPAEEGGQAESFNLWVCKYENDVLLDLEFEELIEQLHLYNDYKAEMDENEAKEEAAESAAEVKKVGAIAAENIIHTKRARVSVDYSKLNEEMFDDQFVE